MTASDQEQPMQPDEQASEQGEGGAEQERARPRSGGRARAADRGGDQVATEPATAADEAPAPAEDPVSVIAAGGHLDASGNGCYCDRGGGHAPLTEEERSAYANQERTQPAPPPSEEPLSTDERAELEQLRAERAARART